MGHVVYMAAAYRGGNRDSVRRAAATQGCRWQLSVQPGGVVVGGRRTWGARRLCRSILASSTANLSECRRKACRAMAFPRCSQSVTQMCRTKLQCKREKTKGGYKRLDCVVLCLHGGLHPSCGIERPSIGTGGVLAIRRRWAHVACNGGQHIGSSRECTAGFWLMESPHRLHRSFSSVHLSCLDPGALQLLGAGKQDRPGRAEGFCEVVFCLVVVDARCHRQDLRTADNKTSRAKIPRRHGAQGGAAKVLTTHNNTRCPLVAGTATRCCSCRY